MKKQTLKKCPFCGKPAKAEPHLANNKHVWDIGCSTKYCFCQRSRIMCFDSEDEAILEWNDRKPEKLT